MNEEAEGNLKGKRKMKTAIPQWYQELDLGDQEARRLRIKRLGGGPTSQSDTGTKPHVISALQKLLPPT